MTRGFRHRGIEKFFTTGSKAWIQVLHATRLSLILGRLYASASPDPHERGEQFTILMEAYQRKPSWSTLRVMGLVRTMDPVSLPFFQELIRRGLREDAEDVKAHHIKEIIYRATNFPDPEVAWDLYREVLDRLKDPDLPQPGMRILADPIFQRLGSHYPDRLEEIRYLIRQLPLEVKRSWSYRRLMERMPEL